MKGGSFKVMKNNNNNNNFDCTVHDNLNTKSLTPTQFYL